MKHWLLILQTSIFFVACQEDTQYSSQYEVHGIDISHYQSRIDWQQIAASSLDFVYMKATEGENYIDSLYQENWEDSRMTSLKRGAYHFYRPNVPPLTQANHFIQQAQLQAGDLPPVLDIEVLDGVSNAELIVDLRMYLRHLETHYGVKPVIYTYQKFYNKHLAGHFTDYPIWIARYHQREPTLANKADWLFWQHACKGELLGIEGKVDLNVFQGTREELETWCLPKTKAAMQLANR